jgi:hypothetical protein
MLIVVATAIFVLLCGSDDLLEFFRQEVIGRHDIRRLRLLECIHRILAPQIVRHAEGEEGVHPLMLAVRGHVAVAPGGAELGQIDGHDLVDMDELACLAEGKELALEKGPRLLAGGVLQTTSFFVFEEHPNRIFNGRTTRLRLIDAGGVGLSFLLAGISFRLLPASRAGRLADGFSIGQDATEPFGAAAAPPLGIVCVAAIGGVTGIDMEHRSQPPYKEVNSGGGTKLVQFVRTACKSMIYR